MTKFKHCLTTRFNCPYPKDPNYPANLYEQVAAKSLSPAWLEDRIEKFEKFCKPSVEGQTNKNFTWLLFCNAATPEPYKSKFESYNSDLIRVVFTEVPDRFIAPKILQEEAKKVGAEWSINTQCDNDDALHRLYIDLVQQEFRSEVEFLNIPRGFKYDTREDKCFGTRSDQSPFRTFVEKAENARSVYCTVHGASHTIAPIRQIHDTTGYWLQVIHGDNVINKRAKKSKDKGFPLIRIARGFTLEHLIPAKENTSLAVKRKGLGLYGY